MTTPVAMLPLLYLDGAQYPEAKISYVREMLAAG
jgi:hypothetical protein